MPPASEEQKAKQRAAMKARWADPEYKAKMAEALRKGWAKPGAKEARRLSDDARARIGETMRGHWQDPQFRAKCLAAWEDPERRARAAEDLRARWGDPGQRAEFEEQVRSPERRAAIAEALRALQVKPEDLPPWLGPALEYAALIVTLRKQDGDLCQLCLEPIDFSLVWPDPGYVNADHIVPQAAGGTDDPDNLWLAHALCNNRKNSFHAGRRDGSRDRRRTARRDDVPGQESSPLG